MKKLNYLILTLLFIGLFTSSCNKDKQTSPVKLNTEQTATFKGLAFAQLDLLNDSTTPGHYEFVPSGTKILVTINAAQYNVNPPEGVEFTDLLYETTVGSNGVFTIDLPSNTKGVKANVIFDDFEYNQGQITQDLHGYYIAGKSIRKIFHVAPFEIKLVVGQTVIKDTYYSEN
jgi:hypothetical protein